MVTNSKAPFDRRVRFKPTSDNRQEAVDRIIWGLHDIAIEKRDEKELSKLVAIANQHQFDEPDYWMMMYTFWSGVKASSQVLKNDISGWSSFSLMLHYSFWGQLNAQHYKKSIDSDYVDPLGGGMSHYFTGALRLPVAQKPLFGLGRTTFTIC